MRDVFARAVQWIDRDGACALATLVASHGGSPVREGTTIAVSARGEIAGSIGAGCYEGEIVETAAQTLADGAPRTVRVDLARDEELEVPGCGGVLELLAWRAGPGELEPLRDAALGAAPVTFDLPYAGGGGSRSYRLEVAPRGRLVLVGATSLADAIARQAAALDFDAVVVDPRPALATRERLPHAREILVRWPDDVLPALLDARTPAIVLSHDAKIDLPALRCALRSPAPYVGMLGSRRSAAARRERLRSEGFGDADLARVRGPAGLDIGGSSVAETALSILAELVAVLRGAPGGALVDRAGPIHSASAARANAS